MESRGEKILLSEAVIAGLWLFALPDAVELLLALLGLDDFWISDILAFPGSMIYLKMKGVKSTFSLIANIIELIPYAGTIPIRTIGFVATVIFENHKDKIQQGLQIAGDAAKIAKIIPQTRLYAEIIEKGTKMGQTTMNALDKNNISNISNFKRVNSYKNSSINNIKSFEDIKLGQKISLNKNITESIKNQEKINNLNAKRIPKLNNVDIEKLNKKYYNEIELDDDKNIINLKNAA